MNSSEVLEVLEGAERRLMDRLNTYYYWNWSTCGCGHIYAAAMGRQASECEEVWAEDLPERYATVLLETAGVLGWLEGGYWKGLPRTPQIAASYISALMMGGEREDALMVIRRAIERIRAMHEEDRQAVLARAAAVVDSASANELVHA